MTDQRAVERDPMTGAALRCIRERLGLTTRWLADHLDVAERSVHRWESGAWPVPDGVRRELEVLQARHAGLVDQLVAGLVEMPDPVLTTYRTDDDAAGCGESMPASWHRALVGRVLEQYRGATVVYQVP